MIAITVPFLTQPCCQLPVSCILSTLTNPSVLDRGQLWPWLLGAFLLFASMVGLLTYVLKLNRQNRTLLATLTADEMFLAATLDAISDAVIATDKAGRIAHMNNVAQHLTGFRTEEAQAAELEDVFRIVDTNGRPPSENPVITALTTGRPCELTGILKLMCQGAGGRLIVCHAAPIYGNRREPLGAVLVFRDVTESHAKDLRLATTETSNRLLVENALSAIAVLKLCWDNSGKAVDYEFLQANPAFRAHTGLIASDVVGKRATQVIPGIEETGFIQIFADVAQSSVPVSFEQFCKPLDRHFAVNAYSIGENLVATVFTDITSRKLADAETLKTFAEMERLNRLMAGREKRVVELKKQVNALLLQLGRAPDYESVEE